MSMGQEPDELLLSRIVEIAEFIQEDITGLSEADFRGTRNTWELTAYRLAAIGETTRKLSLEVRQRHPEINWANVDAMRNIIVHHYGKIDPEVVWKAVSFSLPILVVVCRQELERLDR